MKRLSRLMMVATLAVGLQACTKSEGLAYPSVMGDNINQNYYQDSDALENPVSPEAGDRFGEFSDNDFIKTSDQNVSTFSIDADGAAYGYMRKMLSLEMLPKKASFSQKMYTT